MELIGLRNCSKCDVVKEVLENNNVPFTYVLFNDLNNTEKKKYMDLAREEDNSLPFPIIISDNQVISLQEALNVH